MKRIKYEIRLGEPNRPIGEPNRPMTTSPKKVEPILRMGPWQDKGPDLPTTFQKTCSTRMRGLLYKEEKLALQGGETCSTRMRLALQGWSLLYKDEACSARMRLAPQGKEAGPHHYKKAPTSSQKGPNILTKR